MKATSGSYVFTVTIAGTGQTAITDTVTIATDGTVTVGPKLAAYVKSTQADTFVGAGKADFQIDFKFDGLRNLFVGLGYTDANVTITYEATLTAEAIATNVNDVTLDYSNDPNNKEKHKELKDKTEVYSFGLDVDKTFTDDSTPVTKPTKVTQPGEAKPENREDNETLWDQWLAWEAWDAWAKLVDQVEFNLYKGTEVKDANKLYFDAAGVYDPDQTRTDGYKIKLDENGNLKVYGLAPGTYTLVEAVAPKGYSKAANVEITIDGDGNVVASTSTASNIVANSKGVTNTSTETVTTGYTLNEEGIEQQDTLGLETTVTVEQYAGLGDNQRYYKAVTETKVKSDNKSYLTFDVNNSTKDAPDLPGTGGMGVWLFGIGGMLMLAGAAYVYTSRRKRGQA